MGQGLAPEAEMLTIWSNRHQNHCRHHKSHTAWPTMLIWAVCIYMHNNRHQNHSRHHKSHTAWPTMLIWAVCIYMHIIRFFEVAQLVGALCCNPEGRGFRSRWGEKVVSNLSNPSSRTMSWGPISL
jgi:hypothetical protein